jgi:hypothetical protein
MLYRLVERHIKKINYNSRNDYHKYMENNYNCLELTYNPKTYWLKTVDNFAYLYDFNTKLLDHFHKKQGTNTYISHKNGMGGQICLSDNGRFKLEIYGSGLLLIDFSAGDVISQNETNLYNWTIPMNNCSKCSFLNPIGPYNDRYYNRNIDKMGTVTSIYLRDKMRKNIYDYMPNFY